jgi:hypothetical protein
VANAVVKVQENSSLVVTDDCTVIPNACAETKGFNTAKVKYQIWKNNLPVMRNEIDACEAANKMTADIKTMLKLFGLPSKCPVEKVR